MYMYNHTLYLHSRYKIRNKNFKAIMKKRTIFPQQCSAKMVENMEFDESLCHVELHHARTRRRILTRKAITLAFMLISLCLAHVC